MRFFFAIAALALAAILFVLGVGQRTFLAGPKVIEHELVVEKPEDPYLVVPASIFDTVSGTPAIVIAGQDPFMAIGHSRDIDAWVRSFDHAIAESAEESIEFSVSHKKAVLEVSEDSKNAPSEEEAQPLDPLDPRGSDLWLVENEAETSLKVSLAMLPGQSLLITSSTEEGFKIPESVTLSWAQPRQTPLAGPLLLGAGIFAVAGIILYLLAIDHSRRGIGPRRGRRGPLQGIRNRKMKQKNNGKTRGPQVTGRGSRMGFAVSMSAFSIAILTACSPSYWPQFDSPETKETETLQPEDSQAVVPVTDAQIDLILERLVDTTQKGDVNLDSSALQDRLASSALAQRSANYKILKEQPDWRKLPLITQNRLSYDLVQSTEKWPRTLFLTVESVPEISDDEEPVEEELASEPDTAEPADAEPIEPSPTLALVMTQNDPHSNYILNRVVELRGGIEMPEAAPLNEGTALLADDIQTLQLSPRDAGLALADAMKNGEESESFEAFQFNDELLIEKMGRAWAKDQCIDGLKCSVDVVLSDEPIISFSTGQSGALLLATLQDKHTMAVTSDRNIVKLSKVERALGLDGGYTSVTREWQHQVLLYVPGTDSDKKITVLGSSSELVKASGKKA